MPAPLWTPSPDRIRAAAVTRFMAFANSRRGLKLSDYAQLYDWSIRRPADFWSDFANFARTPLQNAAAPVIDVPGEIDSARFFPGATLNFAESLLRPGQTHQAILFRNELGHRRELSRDDLRAEVARVASGLRSFGIRPGDRIAGFLPNIPEAVVAMLAATSIGAVWSACSPDFGASATLQRFRQIAPRLLFTADGYSYAGKRVDSLAPLSQMLKDLPSVERVVVVPYMRCRLAEDLERFDVSAVLWEDFARPSAEPHFEQLPFAHPVYILYSSGTTGPPKCIVHGAGGTLLQHQKEHLLHADVHPGDRVFYFTTCAWMMWHWLVSALASDATLFLYDGSPTFPAVDSLWRLAADEHLQIFGTSATFLARASKAGCVPAHEHDLSALKTILSTGSPLLPETYDYVYRDVKADVLLSSISGGSDIISCFALGSPLLPVYRGEIQCRGLGMPVDVFDDDGSPIRHSQGELVCTAPFPSMPVGFWNDPDRTAYRRAYFERFPGVWHHGDFATLTAVNGLVIHGRSDAVLNPGGVRIGTAEVYSAVEDIQEIAEAMAISQEWCGDVRVVLFVILQTGCALTSQLCARIKQCVRLRASPRHVPAKIIAVPDLPRTHSGKLSELAVREIVHRRPVKNTESIANPDALQAFRDLPDLQSE